MDIAAAVGAERLREIMTDVFTRSSAVVQRYGDEASYREFHCRYRAMATALGFAGHIAIAEAMD